METLTDAAIATLLLTKMIEKLEEMAGKKLPDLGEALWEQVENLRQKLWHNEPEIARAIELITYQPDLVKQQSQDCGLEVLAGKIELAASSDLDLTQIIAALAAFIRQLFDFDGNKPEEPPIDFNNYKKPEEPPIKNTVRLVLQPEEPLVENQQPEEPLIENTWLSSLILAWSQPKESLIENLPPKESPIEHTVQADRSFLQDPRVIVTNESIQPYQETADDDPVQVSKSYQKIAKTQHLGC
ncbi:MAG: hypothetical protein P2A85_29110 (plasmid) [Microcoleus anatoxicus]|uniref:hypothetical protein n=1 Tax=Microcoleus anatoxicus TaxID=2705319 RepID=UPI00366F1F7C